MSPISAGPTCDHCAGDVSLRFSTLSLIALCTSLGLGLLPGVIAQLEILEPGLQVFAHGDEGLYNLAVVLHGAALSQSLPLAAIALSIGVATDYKRLPLLRILGMLSLAACPLAFLVMAWAGFNRAWDLHHAMQNGASTSAFVLLIANIVLTTAQVGARISLAILTGLSLLAFGFGMLIGVLIGGTPDSFLIDTYVDVAARHAIGISAVLGALAGATAYVMQQRNIRALVASIIGGFGIAVVGYVSLSLTLTAGFLGMPRGYVDYADSFARVLQPASIWALVLATVAIAAFGWVLSNLRHKPPPGPEAVFD